MKKLGKAKIDLDRELWGLENKSERFHMNRRLVETRPDVKRFMSKYKKTVHAKRPTRREPEKREEYFKARDEGKKQLHLFMSRVYKDILEESFSFPIPLRLDHDFDHNSDWRYCLYKGNIYQFDKPGLSDDEMIRQIEKLEGVNHVESRD